MNRRRSSTACCRPAVQIIHRDLKLENILLKGTNVTVQEAKLAVSGREMNKHMLWLLAARMGSGSVVVHTEERCCIEGSRTGQGMYKTGQNSCSKRVIACMHMNVVPTLR